MKQYPSIPGFSAQDAVKGLPCIAFKKYDGSNLRFKWKPKKGFHLFGTRSRLFDYRDPDFGCAIEIFIRKWAGEIEKVIASNKLFRGIQEVTCFCEFFGPYSFAGQHDPKHPALNCPNNDPKSLVLFDVNLHKKGFLFPRDFLKAFGHLPIAEVVYEGNLNQSFIQDVREGKYPVFEGVVCKGINKKNLWMTKIKTLSYLEELKKRFSSDWSLHWE